MQSSWKALIVVYLGSSAFYLDIYHNFTTLSSMNIMKILISKELKIEKFYSRPFLLVKAIHFLLDIRNPSVTDSS